MVKADMRKGMLLKGKIGAEERIYRVLDLKEKVLVLDCVKKCWQSIRDGMCDFDKLVDIIGNYEDKEGNPVVIESKF